MKTSFLFLNFLLFPLLSFSQVQIEWQNTIGGNNDDYLFSVQQTSDGGYILGGFSDSDISGDKTENSLGDSDYWIVKIDTNGNIQWQNTIGGSNGDDLTSIQQTSDGGYILGGSSASDISGDKTENSLGDSDYWIVKTDAAGNIQWQNTIGGVMVIILIQYSKLLTEDTSWAERLVPIFQETRQKTATKVMIIGL